MLALLAESKLNGKKYFEFCQKLSSYNYYANAKPFFTRNVILNTCLFCCRSD